MAKAGACGWAAVDRGRPEPGEGRLRRSGMTAATRRWTVLTAALVTATTTSSGCARKPEPATIEWREPAGYTYDLDSACGERALIGHIRITVEQGRVTAAVGLDEPGRRALRTTRSDPPPTLGGLLDEVNRARKQGAAVAEVAADPADGHPSKVTIDPIANAVDDDRLHHHRLHRRDAARDRARPDRPRRRRSGPGVTTWSAGASPQPFPGGVTGRRRDRAEPSTHDRSGSGCAGAGPDGRRAPWSSCPAGSGSSPELWSPS